jgi:hypothetical protein
MANRRSKQLTREGEPSQKTDKGLEIPIPATEEFFRLLNKATKKKEAREKPSQSEKE